MSKNEIIAALIGVLNAPIRPTAIYPLARIKYPRRELAIKEIDENTIALSLPFYGYEYKHRGKKPKHPPQVDVEAIRTIFQSCLADLTVGPVTDGRTSVSIIIKGGKPK